MTPPALYETRLVPEGEETLTNRAVLIGCIGIKTVYINVCREDAINRYVAAHPEFADEIGEPGMIREFEFIDEFGVYEAWEPELDNNAVKERMRRLRP
jgi:hypothetical protein